MPPQNEVYNYIDQIYVADPSQACMPPAWLTHRGLNTRAHAICLLSRRLAAAWQALIS
jgi:hypothetical protein